MVNNANMPAMPQSFSMNEGDCGVPATHLDDHEQFQGLTKLEMFAKDAPEMPDWFERKYLDEVGYKETTDISGSTPIFEANMDYPHEAMYFAWRVYYANTLLAELDKEGG